MWPLMTPLALQCQRTFRATACTAGTWWRPLQGTRIASRCAVSPLRRIICTARRRARRPRALRGGVADRVGGPGAGESRVEQAVERGAVAVHEHAAVDAILPDFVERRPILDRDRMAGTYLQSIGIEFGPEEKPLKGPIVSDVWQAAFKQAQLREQQSDEHGASHSAGWPLE